MMTVIATMNVRMIKVTTKITKWMRRNDDEYDDEDGYDGEVDFQSVEGDKSFLDAKRGILLGYTYWLDSDLFINRLRRARPSLLFITVSIIVAKAAYGQRYPLPLSQRERVCDGKRGSGPERADDLCLSVYLLHPFKGAGLGTSRGLDSIGLCRASLGLWRASLGLWRASWGL